MANPLDHPVDNDLRIDVPGQLRAAAKKRRASGQYRVAADMEAEARRVELKRQGTTPGQRAVISRMHARENMADTQSLIALVIGGSVALGVVTWAWRKGR